MNEKELAQALIASATGGSIGALLHGGDDAKHQGEVGIAFLKTFGFGPRVEEVKREIAKTAPTKLEAPADPGEPAPHIAQAIRQSQLDAEHAEHVETDRKLRALDLKTRKAGLEIAKLEKARLAAATGNETKKKKKKK